MKDTRIQLGKMLEDKHWRFAKTAVRNPHWYTLRKDWDNDYMFDNSVKYIRLKGQKEMFWGVEYTCLYVGKFKYWTMGYPVEETTLINKAEI